MTPALQTIAQKAGVCLVDLAKDESASTESSVSSRVPLLEDSGAHTIETETGRSSNGDELRQGSCDYSTPTRNRLQDDVEISLTTTPSPSTSISIYNPFTQHNYSSVRNQRRLSGIGLPLSLNDIRNVINQEFHLLGTQEEKKLNNGEEIFDDESDCLDPDEQLALVAHQIRAELRQSEMLELAKEAERAAEAGMDSFMGRASTFGDDLSVLDSSKVQHPATLKRNSTYSEGFLHRRPLDQLRPRRPKIRVLALRAVDEVIPSLGEIHSHLRTHLARSGVDEETLLFHELDAVVDTATMRSSQQSSGFFRNFRNWVSTGSNMSSSSTTATVKNELPTNHGALQANSTPHSPLSTREERNDDSSESSVDSSLDSSVVGEVLAQHIMSSSHLGTTPHTLKVPPGLVWSATASAGPNSVPESITVFDDVDSSSPHLPTKDAHMASNTLSPSFEEIQAATRDGTSYNVPSSEGMIPIVLFEAEETGESALDQSSAQAVGPHSLDSSDMAGLRSQVRPTQKDFLTPVRLHDMRELDNACGLRRGLASSFPILWDKPSSAILLPRPRADEYTASTFISDNSDSPFALKSEDNIPVRIKIVDQTPLPHNDEQSSKEHLSSQNAADEVKIESAGTNLDSSQEEKNARRGLNVANNVKARGMVAVEEREDSAYHLLQVVPSTDSSSLRVRTPDDTMDTDRMEGNDTEERIQPSPAATDFGTLGRGDVDDNCSSQHSKGPPIIENSWSDPATPTVRNGCECLRVADGLSSIDDFDLKHSNSDKEHMLQLRRVASCPSFFDIMDLTPDNDNGIARPRSELLESSSVASLGLDGTTTDLTKKSSSKRNTTRRSESFQVAMDNMIAKLSPATCGNHKYPYIPHAENNDFLNNYLYCSKPAEQWSLLDTATSFDENPNSPSVQCVNFIFGSNCDGLAKLINSLFPDGNRRAATGEVFSLNNGTYTEVDPDSWFNIAAERFDGALERFVGRAREHSKRFQAPSLKKKPPSVLRLTPPSDEIQREERSPTLLLSDQQFLIIYGMSREQFQELHSVAKNLSGRFRSSDSL